jgi:hypothetical protein
MVGGWDGYVRKKKVANMKIKYSAYENSLHDLLAFVTSMLT